MGRQRHRRPHPVRVMNWIPCADGSWVNAAHVTRLFIAEDITTKGWQLKASTTGPAHPFVITSGLSDKETATLALKNVINRLTTGERSS